LFFTRQVSLGIVCSSGIPFSILFFLLCYLYLTNGFYLGFSSFAFGCLSFPFTVSLVLHCLRVRNGFAGCSVHDVIDLQLVEAVPLLFFCVSGCVSGFRGSGNSCVFFDLPGCLVFGLLGFAHDGGLGRNFGVGTCRVHKSASTSAIILDRLHLTETLSCIGHTGGDWVSIFKAEEFRQSGNKCCGIRLNLWLPG